MKNNNKEVIRKLSKRSLKNNQMRNLFAIMAIALTSLLFTSVFTMGSGVIQQTEAETMRRVGSTAHGGFKDVTEEEYRKLVQNPRIKDYGYDVFIGMAENKELAKRQTEIRYIQPSNMKFGFTRLVKGRLPKNENEVVLDTIVLNMMKVPYKIGEKVSLKFNFLGKSYDQNYVLSGWYQGDPVMGASTAYISEGFLKRLKAGWSDEKIRKSKYSPNGEGLYQVNVMFKNSFHIEENMKKVIKESGLSLGDKHIGVNWAYVMDQVSDVDAVSVTILVVIFLVIMLTGFLIIYNIFQISILNDIQFYGLLKTIGTTKKQIKALVRKQALLLSLIGTPIGLLMGFMAGKSLMPVIFGIATGISSIGFSLKMNPYIFLFSAVFSLFTVLISCIKPSKIAGSVSPVEALKYTEGGKKYKKDKKTTAGAKIYKMAFANLARNKKKTIVVISSLSLSVVVLTEVVTFSKSFSLDSYLESMLTGDVMICSSGLLHYNGETKLQDDFYKEALKQEGVEESFLLYQDKRSMSHTLSEEAHRQFEKLYKENKLSVEEYNVKETENTLKNNKPIEEDRYAYEEGLLKKLKVLHGTFDIDKFRTGKYILVSPVEDSSESYYKPGDKVTLNFADKEPKYKKIKDEDGKVIDWELIVTKRKEYEVMAVVNIPYAMTSRSFSVNGLTTILPKEELLKMDQSAQPFAASFMIADDKEAAFQDFLKTYTTQKDPSTDYITKESLRKEFSSMSNNVILVGSALALIVAIVGILNFINTMLTGVITRKREFAMLQSIGLTNDQLKKMLLYEGIYYVGFTAGISLILGSLLSVTAIRAFNNIAVCFQYKFTLLPFLGTIPVFLIIAFTVPLITYQYVRKFSIVERLREE